MPAVAEHNIWMTYLSKKESNGLRCIIHTLPGCTKHPSCDKPFRDMGNFRSHVSLHELKEDSPLVKELIATAKKKALALQPVLSMPRFTDIDKEVVWYASGFDAMLRCENPAGKLMNFKITDRRKLREQTLLTAEKLLGDALKRAEETCGYGTLAIDSGTIWNRYLAGVLHVPGMKPIVIGLYGDGQFVDKKQTAENIHLFSDRIANMLRGRAVGDGRIAVAVVTADNAKNFQSARALPSFLVGLRCYCHVLQLIANELIKSDESIKAAKEALEEVRASFPGKVRDEVPTRWNYTFLALGDALQIDSVYPRLKERMALGYSRLKPLYCATNELQSDNATLWGALSCTMALCEAANRHLDTVPLFRTVLESRLDWLVVETAMALIFLVPECWDALPEKFEQTAHATILRLTTVVEAIRGPEQTFCKLSTELNTYCSIAHSISPAQEQVTFAEAASWWTSRTNFPRLTTVFYILATATPSEASVERVFSQIKRQLDPQQTRVQPDLVLAQLQVNTLWEDFKKPTNVTVNEVTDEGLKETTMIRTAETEGRPWNIPQFQGMMAILNGKRRVEEEEEEICNMCGKSESEHACRAFLECATCVLWYARTCVELSQRAFDRIDREKSHWQCPKCSAEISARRAITLAHTNRNQRQAANYASVMSNPQVERQEITPEYLDWLSNTDTFPTNPTLTAPANTLPTFPNRNPAQQIGRAHV